MRATGSVRQWDAARGFGFIRTADTADVFFHVRDWRGSTAPSPGMAVQFERIDVGGKGPRAMAVQPVHEPTRAPAPAAGRPARQTSRRPQARPTGRPRQGPAGAALWWWPALLLWFVLLGVGLAMQRLPLWVLAVIGVMNLVAFAAYMLDKSAAQRGGWRTRESTLHLFDLLGGWPAARGAQQLFRHKSSKAEFQRGYAAAVVLHLGALAAWVFGLAQRWVH